MSAARALDFAIDLTERGFVPDAVLRRSIRLLLRRRSAQLQRIALGGADRYLEEFAARMGQGPIAPAGEASREQHYEVPAAFFQQVLGRHCKYSCALWERAQDLDAAEADALEATCRHAEIADGQRILELGCGWGSLSLWLAERYPRARITAVSNSASQRAFIQAQAGQRGIANLQVLTADMNSFDSDARFDRVVSVEMFEHMRNWPALFARIHRWLVPDGRFFMHVFCHRELPYAFGEAGASDWMAKHFFAGGIMPSHALPRRFQDDLQLLGDWHWPGWHYQRTAEAWLARQDRAREAILPILAGCYGPHDAGRWFMRWRMFFMACAELFGYREGAEWGVGHYLFRPR